MLFQISRSSTTEKIVKSVWVLTFVTISQQPQWTLIGHQQVRNESESNENEFTLTCKCSILIYELTVVVILFLENQRRALRR